MYQKDYILRMIEMLGDLLAAIFGLVRKGDYNQASEKLERIYYDMLKEDAATKKQPLAFRLCLQQPHGQVVFLEPAVAGDVIFASQLLQLAHCFTS